MANARTAETVASDLRTAFSQADFPALDAGADKLDRIGVEVTAENLIMVKIEPGAATLTLRRDDDGWLTNGWNNLPRFPERERFGEFVTALRSCDEVVVSDNFVRARAAWTAGSDTLN